MNTCRRELRFYWKHRSSSVMLSTLFLVDPSTRRWLRFVARLTPRTSVVYASSSNSLSLSPQDERVRFSVEVGRLYGETSNYVHLTFTQVEEWDRLIRQGAQLPRPSEHTIEPLLGLMSRVLAASFVYIAHPYPPLLSAIYWRVRMGSVTHGRCPDIADCSSRRVFRL